MFNNPYWRWLDIQIKIIHFTINKKGPRTNPCKKTTLYLRKAKVRTITKDYLMMNTEVGFKQTIKYILQKYNAKSKITGWMCKPWGRPATAWPAVPSSAPWGESRLGRCLCAVWASRPGAGTREPWGRHCARLETWVLQCPAGSLWQQHRRVQSINCTYTTLIPLFPSLARS